MDDSFFAYIHLVELLAFFSGYPLLYALIYLYAVKSNVRGAFKNRLLANLPYAYALVGTLYFALQLKNLFPDFHVASINSWIQSTWLVSWGILSLLFWIPAVAKKTILSLLHSLVFLLFIVKDLINQIYTPDNYILRNDMTLFSYSLMINLGAIFITFLVSFFLSRDRSNARAEKY